MSEFVGKRKPTLGFFAQWFITAMLNVQTRQALQNFPHVGEWQTGDPAWAARSTISPVPLRYA
jgi:hypothetical protein